MITAQCPFCGSEISPAQLAELREKIKKGQDPAILREMETLRDVIRSEEKEKSTIEVQAIRSKLEEYQKRERELDKRDAEIKAREVTIEDEVRKRLATGEKTLRDQITLELSQKQRAELEGRDRQISELRKEMNKQKEIQQSEVERLVAERETQMRQEEKTRLEKAYEPLRSKIAEYQKRESSLLEREEAVRLQQEEVALAVERGVREKENRIRQEEKLRVDKTYEPLRLKIADYQKREEEFLRREQALSLREGEIELRVAREVGQKREEILKDAQKQAEEKHGIQLKENEQVIADLRRQLEDAQRLIQTGSAQRRGLIQEEGLADQLQQLFPDDEIVRISSGVRGADVLQNVRGTSVGQAGCIYWESKRTKDFQHSWVAKLRQDQQERKADIAGIVTLALPEGSEDFSIIDGVVVLHPRVLPPVATLMRQYLLNLARQRLTMEQRDTKIHHLFQYMTSNDFLQRVVAIVDAQARLADLNDKERRAHERVWAMRDQLQLGIGKNIAGLYGDIEGIVGALPTVQGLQLPAKSKPEISPGDKT